MEHLIKKALDSQNVKKHYEKRLKQSFHCPDCKKKYTNITYSSKHGATKLCKNARGEFFPVK